MKFMFYSFILLCFVQSATADVSVRSSGTKYLGIKTSADVEAFLGIPYAEPPVRHLRWKAPRPISMPPVFHAKQMGSICPQLGNMFAGVSPDLFGKPVGQEDCLYLNIWRPKEPNRSPRPVFFWIHGGSNSKGTANDPNYDGTYFAETNDAIFVSVNYRLGVFGAFLHESLYTGDKLDDSGNYVTLDLIQALKWVQDNISAFGGDPNRVVIAGQSAGCMNVWGLLQSPLAKDLFSGAICSAGVPNSYPRQVVEYRSQDLLYDLMVADGYGADHDEVKKYLKKQNSLFVGSYLRSKTPQEILSVPRFIVPTQHIADGYVLPHVGMVGVSTGNYNKVPLILGATSNEATYMLGVPMLKVTEAELYSMINSEHKDSITREDLIDSTYLRTFDAITATGSQGLLLTLDGLAKIVQTHQREVYRYEFSWHESPEPWNSIFKSFHGLDALFYIGNFVEKQPNFARFAWMPSNKHERERLRSEMFPYFRSFLHHGNPNYGNSLPRWNDYSIDGDVKKFE